MFSPHLRACVQTNTSSSLTMLRCTSATHPQQAASTRSHQQHQARHPLTTWMCSRTCPRPTLPLPLLCRLSLLPGPLHPPLPRLPPRLHPPRPLRLLLHLHRHQRPHRPKPQEKRPLKPLTPLPSPICSRPRDQPRAPLSLTNFFVCVCLSL